MCSSNYGKLGYLAEAHEALNEGLRRWPTSSGLWMEKGRLYLEQREWAESIRCLEEARRLAVADRGNGVLLTRIEQYLVKARSEARKAASGTTTKGRE
jgi:tetratricopeptide (TPR) repeat protein